MAVALALALPALADEPAEADAPTQPHVQQVLGLALQMAPLRRDDGVARWSMQPVWALRYGRWRAGSSRVGSLFGGARAADAGSGASAVIVDNPRWRAGLGLRLDNGQSSAAATSGAVSRDVPRTVRLRGYASWRPDAAWSLGLGVSHDLLNRGGGARVQLDFGRALPEWPGERWGASAGLSWADARDVAGHYGTLASPGRAAYEPGAGWVDVHAGVGATWPLGQRWIVWCQGNISRLLGPAAASPLNQRLLSAELQVGAAWRWY